MSDISPSQKQITGEIERLLKVDNPIGALWALWEAERTRRADEFVMVLIGEAVAARALAALRRVRS